METQLITPGRNPDRWTVVPFVAWGVILAFLVWQLGTANRACVVTMIVVVAFVQATGVVASWKGAVHGRGGRVLVTLLILSLVTISYLALDNTADLPGAAVWPLFAGVFVGLLLQLNLIRRIMQSNNAMQLRRSTWWQR